MQFKYIYFNVFILQFIFILHFILLVIFNAINVSSMVSWHPLANITWLYDHAIIHSSTFKPIKSYKMQKSMHAFLLLSHQKHMHRKPLHALIKH